MKYRKRYDSHHKLLREGELERRTGGYEYKWTDYYGKRHSVYASDLDSLRVKEEKLQLNKLQGLRDSPSTLTISKVYETWIVLKRGIRGSTRCGYVHIYERFLKPYIGNKHITELKRSDMRAFYIFLIEEKGVSLAYLDNIHNVLHQVLQLAVDDDYLRKNPCDQLLKEIKSSFSYLRSQKKEALTLRQEINFLRFVFENPKYTQYFPAFYILANTGLRAGEFTGLRWCDIDLDNLRIDVNHNLANYNAGDELGNHFVIHPPKTQAGRRTVVITEAVREAFLMEKSFQEMSGVKSVDNIDGYKDFVFLTHKGHIRKRANLNSEIYEIIKDYNAQLDAMGISDPLDRLPHFSCHILRHTYATRLIEAGAHIKFVQSQLGHTDIRTTYDIYVTTTEEFKKEQIKPYERYMDAFLGIPFETHDTLPDSSHMLPPISPDFT